MLLCACTFHVNRLGLYIRIYRLLYIFTVTYTFYVLIITIYTYIIYLHLYVTAKTISIILIWQLIDWYAMLWVMKLLDDECPRVPRVPTDEFLYNFTKFDLISISLWRIVHYVSRRKLNTVEIYFGFWYKHISKKFSILNTLYYLHLHIKNMSLCRIVLISFLCSHVLAKNLSSIQIQTRTQPQPNARGDVGMHLL